jgi:hypothetical protein
VLAIGRPHLQDVWTQHVAERLGAFEGLETLILVIDREVGKNGKELIRVNMEDHLVKAQNRLVLQGNCREWKLPAVQVMTRRAFEDHL